MDAMNNYRKGVKTNDNLLKNDIDRAVACLNLKDIPFLLRQETGKQTAILLKEVIDRVIVIDYTRVPEEMNDRNFWRLKGTSIRISKVNEGESLGEWLFSPNTVAQTPLFFQKVKQLPYLPKSGQGAFYKEPFIEKFLSSTSKNKTLSLANWQWLGLFFTLLLTLFMRLLIALTLSIFKKAAKKTKTLWDDRFLQIIGAPVSWIAVSMLWYVAIQVLQFEGLLKQVSLLGLQVFVSAILIRLSYLLTELFSDYLGERAVDTDFPLDDQLVPLIRKTLKVSVIVLTVLIAIQNLGVNVLSVLAGLGLGGLALAMAAKDTAANLFGSIMIILDKPFKVGDWVVFGEVEGIVEEIGFRSTRVRTFYNSQVSVPNAHVANNNVDNMGKRKFRRIYALLGLTYDTPTHKIEAFIEGVTKIVLENPHTDKDNFEICFHSYGEFSLNILLYIFLKVPNWSEELLQRQTIYLQVLKLAEDLEVDFAFPTRTLHLENSAELAKPATPVNL